MLEYSKLSDGRDMKMILDTMINDLLTQLMDCSECLNYQQIIPVLPQLCLFSIISSKQTLF